jgi:hypothetical protein
MNIKLQSSYRLIFCILVKIKIMKNLLKQPLQIALTTLVIFPIIDYIGNYKTFDFQDSLIKGVRLSIALFVVFLIVKKIESNKKSKK